MYLISIYFPLLSFLTCYFYAKKIGFKGVSFISILSLLFTFLSSLFIFLEIVVFNSSCWIEFCYWINIGKFKINWVYHFDSLTSIMLLMVSIISLIVHTYSLSYMQSDPQRIRFVSLLSLFTFFMLLLVTAGNFLQLLLGWEGVGICSYLLVNFWSDRASANKAALKALFLNRVGDFGMILTLIMIYDVFKSFHFKVIFDLTPMVVNEYYVLFGFFVNKIDLISFFLILAAIAKSAQFFSHGWLSDAMEGPTPVSALIHAATMVTAGIFLIVRFSSVLQYSPLLLNCIVIFGAITTVIFPFSGQNTNDLKKIVASSTASQLAYMFFIAGLLDSEGSIFHLFLHAFFKALLFSSAGSIIHGLGDQQDIRKMGGLVSLMPYNTFCFLVGSLSLIGLPAATGGYYSKDPIIENTMLLDSYFDDFLNLSSELGVVNTLYYNPKLIKIVFFGCYKGFWKFAIHDASKNIMFSLSILTLCSFVAPFMWEFLMAEDCMIFPFSEIVHFSGECDLNYYKEEEISSFLFWFILLICMSGLVHSEEIFSENIDSIFALPNHFYSYFDEISISDNVRWGFEYFIAKKFSGFFFSVADFFPIPIDRGFLEFFGPFFIISRSKFLYKIFSSLQSGFLYHYVSLYLLAVFLFTFFIYHNLSILSHFHDFIFFYFLYLFSMSFSNTNILIKKNVLFVNEVNIFSVKKFVLIIKFQINNLFTIFAFLINFFLEFSKINFRFVLKFFQKFPLYICIRYALVLYLLFWVFYHPII